MALYNVGQLIKSLRTQKGIKQDELAQGIMDRTTLSKIERGIAMPSKTNLDALFEKLGYNPNLITNIFMTSAEIEIQNLKDELAVYLVQQRTTEAESLLAQFEKDKRFLSHPLNKQWLIQMQITNEMNKGTKTKDIIFQLHAGLELTIPNFDEKKIADYLLSVQELRLINMIANYYILNSDWKSAYEIFFSLKSNVDSRSIDLDEKGMRYPFIISNLTRTLLELHKYEEVLSICEEGIKICLETARLSVLPSISWNKVVALFELGKLKEAQDLARDVYHTYSLFQLQSEKEQFKNYAENKLGVVFKEINN